MLLPMALAALVVFVALVLLWASRGSEIFCVSVRNGRVLVVRGRAPAQLVVQIREVVQRPPVRSATIRAIKAEMGARLVVSGDIDEGRAQRLRNLFGLYPAAKLRSAPVVTDRTVGQFLGIAWLAWLFDRASR